VLLQHYRTRAKCIHTHHLFCNALVHVIYVYVSPTTVLGFQSWTLNPSFRRKTCPIDDLLLKNDWIKSFKKW